MVTISGIAIGNIDKGKYSVSDYNAFLLSVLTGNVTLVDAAITEFSRNYTFKKIDVVYANYSKLWGSVSLEYSLYEDMDIDPSGGSYLCAHVTSPYGSFPESSTLYFNAKLIIMTRTLGNLVDVRIQQGKTSAEFKYAGRYNHSETTLFCYNCTTVPPGEKALCETLVSNFASFNVHVAALQLNSQYDRELEPGINIKFHVSQMVDNFYLADRSGLLDPFHKTVFPLFLSSTEMHLVLDTFRRQLSQPTDTVYTTVTFTAFTLDGLHITKLYFNLSYTYLHDPLSAYLWFPYPKKMPYNWSTIVNSLTDGTMRGDLTIKHMGLMGNVLHVNVISKLVMLYACFNNVTATLHQASVSFSMGFVGLPSGVLNCLLANDHTIPFISFEDIDSQPALYANDKVQVYILLYYMPVGGDYNRDMHFIGALFKEVDVNRLEEEISLECNNDWLGHSKHDRPMSCLQQLRLARQYMVRRELQILIRVHNDYSFVDSFAYDEVFSMTSFSYTLVICCVCCIAVVFMYYCATLCRAYKRLLE